MYSNEYFIRGKLSQIITKLIRFKNRNSFTALTYLSRYSTYVITIQLVLIIQFVLYRD